VDVSGKYLAARIPNEVLTSKVQRISPLQTIAQMTRALGSMWMAFQPIVDADCRRVFAYEALLRTEERSLSDPRAILGAAEQLDCVHELGRRVRAMTAAAFADARKDALLFVNLHPRDLLDPALYRAEEPLTKIAERVVLEITERVSIDEVEDIRARVDLLRELGFRFAIDDLGEGYAGLSSLVVIEPEFVKLDMSLTRNVHRSTFRQRLLAALVELCRSTEMQAIAEGVESDAEHQTLSNLGCGLQQGYFFAKPGRPFPPVTL
jgi:EAL domain-containing protein (putative c-di-GMP-specific phosphodiesterase class I)